MDETLNLKKLVAGYQANIKSIEQELGRLGIEAESIRGQLAKRDDAQGNLDTLRRRKSALQGERESLKGDHAEASFENDTAALQRIAKRKAGIDSELEEADETIRNLRIVLDDSGLDLKIAELTLTKNELGQKLPKKYYSTSTNQHPMLEAISEVLKADADRLRRRWSSISVPTASQSALEAARRHKGYREATDPAWLVRQEEERQERMERFKDVAGNTDAVASASGRRERKADQRVSVTSGDTGSLSGDEVRAALAAKSA